jgi:hypothetical protein
VDVDASRLPGNQADPAGIALNAGASLQQATAGVGGEPSLLFLPQVNIILCLRYVLLFFLLIRDAGDEGLAGPESRTIATDLNRPSMEIVPGGEANGKLIEHLENVSFCEYLVSLTEVFAESNQNFVAVVLEGW